MTDAAELSDSEVAYLLEVLDLAREGATEQLEALLEDGIPPNLTNAAGDSLLILAAYHARADTVQMLLRHGADHSRVNDRGQTALGAAVFRQDRRGVMALLAAGADPFAGAQSAVAVARFFELDEMAELLASGLEQRGERPR